MGVNIYYFTFGYGQKFQGYVQPVVAVDSETARVMMVSLYGDKWAFQYEEVEYLQSVENGTAREIFLPPIMAERVQH